MIGNDWGGSLPVVGGQNVKRMIVGLGRRSPEMVSAAPADGKPFLAASLNVQNFANIKTTGSGYETTTLEPDFPGTIRVSLKQYVHRPAAGLPERPFLGAVPAYFSGGTWWPGKTAWVVSSSMISPQPM